METGGWGVTLSVQLSVSARPSDGLSVSMAGTAGSWITGRALVRALRWLSDAGRHISSSALFFSGDGDLERHSHSDHPDSAPASPAPVTSTLTRSLGWWLESQVKSPLKSTATIGTGLRVGGGRVLCRRLCVETGTWTRGRAARSRREWPAAPVSVPLGTHVP